MGETQDKQQKQMPVQDSVDTDAAQNSSETQPPSTSQQVLSRIGQSSSNTFDTSGMTSDELKREFDMFRDVLNNVNNTLRFQIQMSVPLLAACITVLNLVPPAEHLKLLNDLDRWVFLPAVLSMAIGYHGLEQHFYSNNTKLRLDNDVKELYKIVRYKYKCVRWGLILQGIGVVLMMIFVMLEYK